VRYGAADVLSSYTGLLDWKLASERGKEKYNNEIAKYTKEKLLVQLYDNAREIMNLTEQGISVTELETILKTLKDFVIKGRYYYSIVNERDMDNKLFSDILSALKS
jgi:hypothetical protein